MNNSDPDHNADIVSLADEFRLAAHRLQNFERAQAEAAALAAPLAQSLRRLAAAAESGRLPLSRGVGAFGAANFLRRMTHRGLYSMSGVNLLDARVDYNPPADDDDLAIPELPSRKAMRVSEENLMFARAEMHAARDAALEAAKLAPMDGLSLRVQHLAAIAQEDGVRGADMAPLSNVWMGASVLQARLTRETGKNVRVEVIADGIYVERRLIAPLAFCVERLVSLAVTNSLEDADARIAAGKPLEGVVTVIAACDHDGLSLTVADDGAGAPAALKDIEACAVALGGGVQILTMPGWGASVTVAIPAPAVGPWRLRIEPLATPGADATHPLISVA